MDETRNKFMAFLGSDKTQLTITGLSRSLSKEFEGYKPEDIKQEICKLLLEKENLWEKIFSMASPWKYIKKMLKNSLMESYRSKNAKCSKYYFKKRIDDILRNSSLFDSFNHKKTMCYAYKNAGVLNPLFLPDNSILEIPFLEQFTLPKITHLKTEERILQLAEYFLKLLEKKESIKIALKIDDLVKWIDSNVNLEEVYAHNDATPIDITTGNSSNSSDDNRENHIDIEKCGEAKTNDPLSKSEAFHLIKKVLQSLDEREKKCLALIYVKEQTLAETALEIDCKVPSGVSNIRDNAVKKIRKALDDKDSLPDTERTYFLDLLIMALNNSD